MENGLGLIHIYTGDGKGKTTAAAGLALRASGSGLRVMFAQFLKGRPTGEIAPLQKAGITVLRSEVTKFVPYMTPSELKECKNSQESIFKKAKEAVSNYDVIILDEIFGAISTKMIEKNEALEFLRTRPQGVEIVMTGRDAPAEFIEMADYVTEMKAVKHPFEKGINARKGIEF